MDAELGQVASAFWTLFDGRRDCYGYGKGLCRKRPVTEQLMAEHLAGEGAIGIYPLTPDGLCHWACVDLDYPDEPEAGRWAKALVLYEALRRLGAEPFIEKSKSKGYHAWLFFREPVEASWARSLMRRALADAGLPADTEIFPRHDRLSDEVPFSGYVNLPYLGGNGDGRRVMLDPATGEPWTADEFLDALTLTDANDVRLGPEADAPKEGDLVIEAGEPEAAPLLGEDAPYGTRQAHAKKVLGLLVRRLWPDGEQAVLDAALNWNMARCKPPLPETQVRDMVRDFWRKEEKKQAKEAQPTAAKSTLRFHTAREIAEETPETPDWLAAPWVCIGSITELTGKAKASGKTTWMLHLVRACLDGDEFLGPLTAKSPVVYLTEERPPTLREALTRAGLLDRDDLNILYWHDTLAVKWPDVVAAAAEKCRQVGARLLAVDTLSQFAGLKADDESASGAALEALRPLQEAAAQGLGILECRHERKGGGEVGESGRGSSAFAGAADVVLKLSRGEGASRPTIRKLEALSRFSETPETLVIELVQSFIRSSPIGVVVPNETETPPSRYVALGTETAVALTTAKQAILEILPTSESEALERKQIEADLPEGVKANALTLALKELKDSGDIERSGQGKRGDPYRYWRRVSFGTTTLVPRVPNETLSHA